VLLAVAATSALAVASAQARAQGVQVTLLSRHVTQGDEQILDATTSRSATCSLSVRYANGHRQPLGRFHAQRHHVEWAWLVPPQAAVGKAKARVACGGAGARTETFMVTRRPPSSVAVVQRGFTQLHNGRGGTNLSWGVALVNRSREEARNVTVYANFIDAQGRLLLTDSVDVAGIAPGATYYAGSVADTAGYPVATKLVPVLTSGPSTPETLVSPEVTNVQVFAGDGDGSAVIDGDVTNDGTQPLAFDAVIFAVLFNSSGQIVGGGLAFPPYLLAPGAQGTFEVDTGPGGPPASSVSYARLSADPKYGSG
jgi:hypothetical protein